MSSNKSHKSLTRRDPSVERMDSTSGNVLVLPRAALEYYAQATRTLLEQQRHPADPQDVASPVAHQGTKSVRR